MPTDRLYWLMWLKKHTLSPGPGLVVQINLSESQLMLFPFVDMIPINYLSLFCILDLCLTVEMYSLWPLTLALALDKSRDTTTSETSRKAYLRETLWNSYSENISLLSMISYILLFTDTKQLDKYNLYSPPTPLFITILCKFPANTNLCLSYFHPLSWNMVSQRNTIHHLGRCPKQRFSQDFVIRIEFLNSWHVIVWPKSTFHFIMIILTFG